MIILRICFEDKTITLASRMNVNYKSEVLRMIIQETLAGSLDWEAPLEKGKPTHSSILAWRIQVAKSWTRMYDFYSLIHNIFGMITWKK